MSKPQPPDIIEQSVVHDILIMGEELLHQMTLSGEKKEALGVMVFMRKIRQEYKQEPVHASHH